MDEKIPFMRIYRASTEELTDTGVTDFFSGMAEGVDCWASLTVLSLREKNPALKLHCVLPCEGQADKWSNIVLFWNKLIL